MQDYYFQDTGRGMAVVSKYATAHISNDPIMELLSTTARDTIAVYNATDARYQPDAAVSERKRQSATLTRVLGETISKLAKKQSEAVAADHQMREIPKSVRTDRHQEFREDYLISI